MLSLTNTRPDSQKLSNAVQIYHGSKSKTNDALLANEQLDGEVEQSKKPPENRGLVFKPGNFLLSHTLARAVPSGLRGLTSVFGKGTGGSLSLWSPRTGMTKNRWGSLTEY